MSAQTGVYSSFIHFIPHSVCQINIFPFFIHKYFMVKRNSQMLIGQMRARVWGVDDMRRRAGVPAKQRKLKVQLLYGISTHEKITK